MNRPVERISPSDQPAPAGPAPAAPAVKASSALEPDWDELARITKELPETDGVPLENPWHLAEINLLLESLSCRWRDRHDYYVGGNMFIYYSLRESRAEDVAGPDFFYVSGVDRDRPREAWIIWMEDGRYPDLIVELLSRTTAKTDRTVKKTLYEKTFRTSEYFIYDPETNRVEGWFLTAAGYQDIKPNPRGWLWSNQLQLWLGPWTGVYREVHATWLRFYDPSGKPVAIKAEAQEERADQAELRADREAQRAEAEKQRAEAAEAELARLKALMAQTGKPPGAAQ